MKIITGKRGTGKTTQLIVASALNNIPIVTYSETHADYIKDLAHRMKIQIPDPISINKMPRCYEEVLVDDAEFILQKIFSDHFNANISAITLSLDEE